MDNRNTEFEIKPVGLTTRELKRHELLSEVDRKLQIGLGLRKTVESFTLQDSPNLVKEGLNNWFTGTVSFFPKDVQDKYREYKQTQKGKGTKNETIQDSGIRFLEAIEGIIQDLTHKNALIHQVKDEPKERIPKIDWGGGIDWSKLNWDTVQEVIVSPFDIVLVIPKKSASEAGLRGFHVPGTPFNFIRHKLDSGEDDPTLKHERIHNFLDGSNLLNLHGENTNSAIARTQQRIARYLTLQQTGVGKAILKNSERMLLEVLNPIERLDVLHEEILAVAENLTEDNGGKRMLNSKLYRFSGLEFDAERSMVATAGRDAGIWASFLRKELQSIRDPFLRDTIHDNLDKFQKLFTKSIQNARRVLKVASKLDGEIENETHTLLYLLPPSQFYHALGYLEFKYGKGRISKIMVEQEKEDILASTDLSVTSLRKIMTFLGENSHFFIDSDRDVLLANIRDRLFSDTYASVQEYKDCKELLGQIFSRLDPDNLGKSSSNVNQPLVIDITFQGNNSVGFQVYQSLSEEEKQAIEKEVERLLVSDIEDGVWQDLNEFLSSDGWKNVMGCGFSDKLLPRIEEMFKKTKSGPVLPENTDEASEKAREFIRRLRGRLEGEEKI